MPLGIDEEHRALAEVVADLAAGQGLRAHTRTLLDDPGSGDPGPAWKRITDLGWTGLHLPEEHGGAGYGLTELAVVLEGLGAAVASGPLLATVLASAVVAEVGTPEQCAALLPALADGSVAASVGVAGDVQLGGAFARLHLVVDGPDLRVVHGEPGERVAGLDPALGLTRAPAGPPDERHLRAERVDESAVRGREDVLLGGHAPAVRVLRVLASAVAAGGARACLDEALAYAKVREQFGRVIGGFQAVKHHLADMLVRSECGVATTWDAARARGPEADLAAAVAASTALEAYVRNARVAIQVFGGIGFTWEHDAHLHLRRATALAALAGPVDAARDDVAALTGQGVTRDTTVALPSSADGFREQAREVVARWHAAPPEDRRAVLVESGYLVPHWPRPWGRAAGPVEQIVCDQELAGVDVPQLGIGGWVLLTLVQTASEDQVRRWVRPSLLGELVWCQLFSEPGAGSDAAAVATRGVRVDGGWRVSGQKVWTSGAQNCNRGLATVRTDPSVPKHRGITTVAVDLTAPGVTVRPLREITGHAAFNEVFFDDVFVPDDDVVGEPGRGWTVARATLGNERVSIGGSAGITLGGDKAAALLDLWVRHTPDDAGLRREIGALVAQEEALRLINLRAVERAVAGAPPSAEGNVTKLITAEHHQHVTELGMRIAGAAAVADAEPALVHHYLFARALTIAGGTSEVTRNVIAERILGLPREAVGN